MPLPPPAAPAVVAPAPPLAAFRWRRRVVLAFASSAEDPRLLDQRRVLLGLTEGVNERDLAFVAVADRTSGAADAAADLRRRFHVEPRAFAVILVGKDGHEALRRDRPIAAAELSAVIDAMPMRRDEAARRR